MVILSFTSYYKSKETRFNNLWHTYQTRDYIPRLSARNDIPFIPDVIEIKENLYIKQVLNSKLNASCSSDSGTLIISVQSAAFNAEDIEKGPPN